MMTDAVAQIEAFNAGRDPERLLMKYRAMRASPFGFFRGTCHLFYQRLPRGGVFKSAPRVWSCGDLHLENFGTYKGDNRLVYFDVNDFDEAALAPATWDLVRLMTSVRVAADRLSITALQAQAACEALLDAYASALGLGKALWVERETAEGVVRTLLDGLRNRERAKFLRARTTLQRGRRRLLLDGKKALPATDAQRRVIMDFMADFAKSQAHPEFYSVLDVARRIAGTGSLGVDRYAILVQGRGSPDGNFLLDLKLAMPSSLVPLLRVAQPKWKTEAHRIVSLQRRMQAVSLAFLQPVFIAERPYVLRALQPSEDRIAVDGPRRTIGELEQAVSTMGRLIAWAQLRSAGRDGSANADELIEFGKRNKWRDRLLGASLDCAVQVRMDAAAFAAAWDRGELSV